MTDEPRGDEGRGGLTRRQFLQVAGASAAGAVAFTGCQPDRRELLAQSRVHVAEDVLTAYENWYGTTCRECGAGCGLVVRIIEGRAKKAEGNPDHPLNRGKLCARGQAAVQGEYHPDRLQGPLRLKGARGSGEFTAISWDEGLGELTRRLRDLQSRPNSVAVLTPPLRAHQALVVDRFTGAYGAQWLQLDPLGETPLREAVRRIFGAATLPEFDIEHARYVVSFGADFLSTWLSPVHYSVEYGVFRQGSYRAGEFRPRRGTPRGYLAQVEPRFSATAANADEWLPNRPGTEGALALAMAQVILSEGLADPAGARAFGDPRALDAYRPDRVATLTGVSADQVRRVARDLATRRPSLAIGGGPAGAHTNGTDNLSAILALNLLVGAVGREGGVRLNPPSPIEDLPAPALPSGLGDWQALAQRLRGGQVQAVLLHNANPVHGLPAALGFRDALLQAPFIVSFSSFLDETTALADLVLPSHLPLEDWGDDTPDPGPGFQVVSLQQPVVRPFYDTRSFWDVLLGVAGELGGGVRQALPWRTFKDALRDTARALQGLGRGTVRDADFERFWVSLLQRGGWWDDSPAGRPVVGLVEAEASVQRVVSRLAPPRFEGAQEPFPFYLVVFRHNTLGAGETAHLPWIQAAPDPVTSAVWQTWVEVNPGVARQQGLREGDMVSIESPAGKIEAAVYVNPAAPPNVLAVPMGQGHTLYGRWAEKRGSNPMDVLAPLTDEATGALAYAATRVRLVKTGRSIRLPKFEGTVESVQLEHPQVVPVVREG